MGGERRVTVRLSAVEAERLDGLCRERGLSQAGVLRVALRDPLPVAAPTVDEGLLLLAESARGGSVQAQIALVAKLLAVDRARGIARSPMQTRRDELARRRKARNDKSP